MLSRFVLTAGPSTKKIWHPGLEHDDTALDHTRAVFNNNPVVAFGSLTQCCPRFVRRSWKKVYSYKLQDTFVSLHNALD